VLLPLRYEEDPDPGWWDRRHHGGEPAAQGARSRAV